MRHVSYSLICDMTHTWIDWYVTWLTHESLVEETCLIDIWDITHWYVTWLIDIGPLPHVNDSLIWDMTFPYVANDSFNMRWDWFIHETWLIYACKTHSSFRYDFFSCLRYDSLIHAKGLMYACERTHVCMRHHSLIHQKGLIHGVMTHSGARGKQRGFNPRVC